MLTTEANTMWISAKLKDLCREVTVGYVGPMALEYVEEGIPFLRSQNIQPFRLDLSSIKYITPEFDHRLKKSALGPGDVVVVRTGNPGIACVIPPTLLHANCSDLVIFRPSESLDSYYLACLFNSTWGQGQVAGVQVGLAQQHFNVGAAKELMIKLPPLATQRKIANILSTWDRAIDLTSQLIAAKRQYKRGLVQQLLTGKRRFKQFVRSEELQGSEIGPIPADWSYVSVGQIAHQVSERNAMGLDLPVLSCTKYDGLVDSLSYFGRQIFSEDTSTYKIVHRHHFAYATNHIEEGSIGYQNFYDDALISPMYTVFKTNSSVDDRFLYALLKTETYRQIFERSTSSSVNRRGSLRWNEFSRIKVPLPSVAEQQAIAEVLDTCNHELALLKSKLELLKKQKKGLMQQLLTGKVRVKI